MARYIDAEKLEKDGWSASRIYRQDPITMVHETKKMTDFPTADVAEVRHGRWIDVDDDTCMCSVCNKEWNFFDNDTYRFLFCPNCGSDMRKETEDE